MYNEPHLIRSLLRLDRLTAAVLDPCPFCARTMADHDEAPVAGNASTHSCCTSDG